MTAPTRTAGELHPLEERVWADLIILIARLPALLDAHLLRGSGITHHEYRVLSVLAQQYEHRMQLSELAVQTQSSRTGLSYVLGKLERVGWIRREPSPQGRGYHAILTLYGHQKFGAARPGYVRLARQLVFDVSTDRQIHALRVHLQTLRDCIEAVSTR